METEYWQLINGKLFSVPEELIKFNPNHDELGRFATGSGGGGDYKMTHRPSEGGVGEGEGAPLHDITFNGTYPENAYSKDGSRL